MIVAPALTAPTEDTLCELVRLPQPAAPHVSGDEPASTERHRADPNRPTGALPLGFGGQRGDVP